MEIKAGTWVVLEMAGRLFGVGKLTHDVTPDSNAVNVSAPVLSGEQCNMRASLKGSTIIHVVPERIARALLGIINPERR